MFVLDGAQANLLIVAAKTDAGVSLFAVDPAGSGVTRTNLATMDQTPKQAPGEPHGAFGTLIRTDRACWTTPAPGLLLPARSPPPSTLVGTQTAPETPGQ